MRKTLFALMMALCVAAVASVASSIAKNSNNQTAPETIVGVISDNHCGAKHQSGSGEDQACVKRCLKGGATPVLMADGKLYRLDSTGQDKAQEFGGEKVKVTGSVSDDIISVTSIERY